MTSGNISPFSSNYTLKLDVGTVDMPGSGITLPAKVCGGNSVQFQVDTGSNGIVMNAADIGPSYTSYPCFGFGEMHYQPSNIIYAGQWYLLPVSVGGTLFNGQTAVSGGSGVGMAMVLVTSGADGHPTGSGMMGVAGKGQNPAFNLFLNMSGQITTSSGTTSVLLPPAYVLDVTPKVSGGTTTYTGVITLGKTYASGEGFGLIALQPGTPPPLPNQVSGPLMAAPALQAWSSPNISIAIINLASNGGVPNILHMSGSLEIDTGLAQGIIAPTPQVYDVLKNGIWSHVTLPMPGAPGTLFITAPSVFQLQAPLETTVTGVVQAASIPSLLGSTKNFQYSFGFNLSNEQSNSLKSLKLDPPPKSLAVMQPANWNPDTVRFNIGRWPLVKYTYMYDALNGVMAFKEKA